MHFLPDLDDWQRIVAFQTWSVMKARPKMIIPFFHYVIATEEERNMTSASASEVVESYRAALGKGDFATARNLLQDDMIFQGPLDTFNKAD